MKITPTITTYKSHDADCSAPQLVMLLLDSAMRYTRDAAIHLRNGRWEDKGRAVDAALACLAELRAGLNHEERDDFVRHLDKMYGFLSTKLSIANASKDPAQFEQIVQSLETVRSAWSELFDRLRSTGMLVDR